VKITTARLTTLHHLTLKTFWTIIRLLAARAVVDGYESLGFINAAAAIA